MSCRGRSSWPWGLAFLTSLGSPDQVRGQVFSSPAALNSNAAIDNGIDVTPQIVTDRAGNWLVAWNGPGNDVLVSRSTDNGATWTPVTAINPTPATRVARMIRAPSGGQGDCFTLRSVVTCEHRGSSDSSREPAESRGHEEY